MALKLQKPIEALTLYERARALPLTEAQAAMAAAKSELAEGMQEELDDAGSAGGTPRIEPWLERY